jgi:hypothetical protein
MDRRSNILTIGPTRKLGETHVFHVSKPCVGSRFPRMRNAHALEPRTSP